VAASSNLLDMATSTKEIPVSQVTVAALPKIIRFTGVHDAGPADPRPNGVCPHCGAEGRYTFHFVCDDGNEYGAMRGCLKLFPVSKIATEDKKLREKQLDLRKRYGGEAHLNSWQTKIREAIDAHYAGELSETDALETIRQQNAKMGAYRTQKYGKRW
jgi:hypothetical protein